MKVNWAKIGGLLPVVVQDSATREVLMMAYMDENALKLTLESGFAHYFSRTKGRIWKKGEESGNVQKVVSATLDCDEDSLLLEVEQTGVACHTGARSCFFNQISNLNGNSNLKDEKPSSNLNKPKYGILDELYHVALERKLAGDPEKSYVAKLYHKGENAYLKKICEEAGELSFAVKDLLKALEIVDNSNLNAENLVREAGQLREARGFGAVSPERKDGLGSSAQSNLNPVAYKVARLNYFFGAPIKRMGLYPDYTVRLFNRKFARFDGRAVHESVVASGEIGALKNHFIHHAYESVEQFIAKQNRYSNLNARPNKIKAIFHPFWAFFRLYVLKGGFLEGWRGYVIARLYAQYTFWKYVKTRAE